MPENSTGGTSVGVISLDLVIKNKIAEQIEGIKSKLTGSLAEPIDNTAKKVEKKFRELQQSELNVVEETTKKIRAEIDKRNKAIAEETSFQIPDPPKVTQGADEAAEAAKNAAEQMRERLLAEHEHLRERLGEFKVSDDPIKRLTDEAELAEEKIEQLQEKWVQLHHDLIDAKEGSAEHSKIIGNINAVEAQMISLTSKAEKLRFKAAEASNESESESRSAGDAAENAAAKGSSAFSKLFSVIKNGSAGGFKAFRAVGSRAVDSIRDKLAKLHSRLSGLTKPAARFGRAIRNAARRIFMMAGILALFKRLRSLLSDAAQSNEQFSKSLNEVKANLSVAFRPVIEAAMPMINKLMNSLAAATRSAAVFINTLFGSTYSKSLETVKGLKAVSKEANALLAPFDEINNLGSESSGTEGIADSLPSDRNAESLASRLKKMLAEGDMAAIGRSAASRINGIFSRINTAISNAQPKIRQGISAFTDIFNSLVDNVDWSLIGDTFGLGFNTVVDGIYDIVTLTDWGNLGSKLSIGLNGFIARVDWTKLGETIGSFFTSALDFLDGAVTDFDWTGLGDAIGNAIDGLQSSFSFTKVGSVAAKSLNGIFQMLRRIIKRDRWSAWAKDLTAGINKFIAETKWDDIGATLGELFTGALDFVYTAITDFDESKAAEAIADLFNNFIAKVDWNELGKALSGGVVKALNFIADLLEDINWEGAGEGIADFLNGIDFTGILKGILRVLKGVLKAIPSLIKGLITNIDFDTAVGIVGTAFGFKLLNKLITYFTTGSGVSGLFSKIGTTLSTKLSNAMSGIGSTIGGKICAGVGAAIAGWQIGTWIREQWGPQIDEFLEPAWEMIFGKADELSDEEAERKARRSLNKVLYGIDSDQKLSKSDIDRAYGAGYEAMKTMADKFGVEVPKAFTDAYENYVNGKKDAIEKSAHDSVSWFSSGLRDSKRYADSAIYVVAEGVKNELGSIKNSALTSGINTVSWFADGVNNNKRTGTNAANSLAAGVRTEIGSAGNSAYNTGWNAAIKLASGLSDCKDNTDKAADYIKDGISTRLGNISSEAETWGHDICDAISRGMDNNISFVTQSAWAAATEIDSILGFSEPEKGPLSNFHTYMPDMMKLMAKGIKDNSGLAINAVSELASGIAGEVSNINMRAPALSFVTGRSRSSGSTSESRNEDYSALRYELRQAIREGFSDAAGSGLDSGDIFIFIDSEQVAARIVRRDSQRVKMTGGR